MYSSLVVANDLGQEGLTLSSAICGCSCLKCYNLTAGQRVSE